ncbi:hypothetical protein A2U01_0009807 [Trifolium medium]|uniref:Uncharacterized protein n=1 Tax=Trifolium medium TaxID=97028 RepID=A0A392MRK4_9FABA|nr:hypothetical protein [Trifolium medium]
MKNNNIIIIICILMFSFFLIVVGRNLPSPSSLNVNFDAPPVQPTLPPPSLLVNVVDVFNDIIDGMITFIGIALFITIVLFFQTCWRLVQIYKGRQS